MQLPRPRNLRMNLTAVFAIACFGVTRIAEAQVPAQQSVTHVQTNAAPVIAPTSAIPHLQQIGVTRNLRGVALVPDTGSGRTSPDNVEKVIPYFGLLVMPFALFIVYKVVRLSTGH